MRIGDNPPRVQVMGNRPRPDTMTGGKPPYPKGANLSQNISSSAVRGMTQSSSAIHPAAMTGRARQMTPAGSSNATINSGVQATPVMAGGRIGPTE